MIAENETKFFERKQSNEYHEKQQKEARGMDKMAAANFSSTLGNMGVFSSLIVSPRVKEIKAVLDSAQQ